MNFSLKNRNWLRHGKGTTAGKIDEMLLEGATIEQIAKRAKTTKATLSVHLTHLRKVRKTDYCEKGRFWVVAFIGSINTTGIKFPIA